VRWSNVPIPEAHIAAIVAGILLTEPMPNIVSVFGGVAAALSIVPKASAQTMRSPSKNASPRAVGGATPWYFAFSSHHAWL